MKSLEQFEVYHETRRTDLQSLMVEQWHNPNTYEILNKLNPCLVIPTMSEFWDLHQAIEGKKPQMSFDFDDDISF